MFYRQKTINKKTKKKQNNNKTTTTTKKKTNKQKKKKKKKPKNKKKKQQQQQKTTTKKKKTIKKKTKKKKQTKKTAFISFSVRTWLSHKNLELAPFIHITIFEIHDYLRYNQNHSSEFHDVSYYTLEQFIKLLNSRDLVTFLHKPLNCFNCYMGRVDLIKFWICLDTHEILVGFAMVLVP